jgi:hypothetical protein
MNELLIDFKTKELEQIKEYETKLYDNISNNLFELDFIEVFRCYNKNIIIEDNICKMYKKYVKKIKKFYKQNIKDFVLIMKRFNLRNYISITEYCESLIKNGMFGEKYKDAFE